MLRCDINTNRSGEATTLTSVNDNRLDDNERATPEPEQDNEEERSDDETIAEHDTQFAAHFREPFGVRHRPHSPEEEYDQGENVSATTANPAAGTNDDEMFVMFALLAPFIIIGLIFCFFMPTTFVR